MVSDTQQKGPWRLISEQVVQYLVVTRDISEWLSLFAIPGTDEEDPDFQDLEELIKQRESVKSTIQEIDPGSLASGPATEDEMESRRVSLDLFRQIDSLEKENEVLLQKFASQYREKIRNIRQARETMTAYNKTQAYSAAATDTLGHYFNQAN